MKNQKNKSKKPLNPDEDENEDSNGNQGDSDSDDEPKSDWDPLKPPKNPPLKPPKNPKKPPAPLSIEELLDKLDKAIAKVEREGRVPAERTSDFEKLKEDVAKAHEKAKVGRLRPEELNDLASRLRKILGIKDPDNLMPPQIQVPKPKLSPNKKVTPQPGTRFTDINTGHEYVWDGKKFVRKK